MSVPLTGPCDPSFEGVREVLRASLESGDNLGAGVTVRVGGRTLVDLRGGYRDRGQTEHFEDALVCVFSSGKAVLSALVLEAVSAGALRYSMPICRLWLGFAAAGKEHFTLGDALSHQTGLAAFTESFEPARWLDWQATCDALADMAPLWTAPGQSGYHPQTFGFIVGEMLRRATDLTVGDHLRHLGADIHCGLTRPERDRVIKTQKPPAPPNLGEITDLKKAAFLSPWSSPAGVSPDAYMAAEIPASNMHGTSAGLAEVMDAFSIGQLGPHAISEIAREEALAERCYSEDLVLPFTLSWGAGVMRNTEGHYGPSPTAVGHYGFGGSCVVADPAHGLSFAFVPNKLSPDLVADPRAMALLEATYAAL